MWDAEGASGGRRVGEEGAPALAQISPGCPGNPKCMGIALSLTIQAGGGSTARSDPRLQSQPLAGFAARNKFEPRIATQPLFFLQMQFP